MGIFTFLIRRIKISATDAAIAAVLVLCVINALVEFWRWVGSPPG